MPNKPKPAKAKKHTNPKGRIALFCYVSKKTLRLIKSYRAGGGFNSQGHVIDAGIAAIALVPTHGGVKRPIA